MKNDTEKQNLKEKIDAALGKTALDIILKNGRVINTFTGEVESVDVAVHKGIIVGLGNYDGPNVVDAEGDYIVPGFIDGHIHLESTMLSLPEFAKAVLPLGTTTVITDPHEIANVLGKKGIEAFLNATEGLPLDIFILLPSCVPSTRLETSGAELDYKVLERLKSGDRVLGLAEVMNFNGVIAGECESLNKINLFNGYVIDGHAPLLSGRALNAYIISGIGSDHECTSLDEASEKIRRGMYIMIREGTMAKNLKGLLPLITPRTAHRTMFVTDDLHPDDLLYKGHINHILDMAIESGIDPVLAIQMVTINPATYFRLKDRGAIAPGYAADIVRVSSLKPIMIHSVYKNGKLISSEGKLKTRFPSPANMLKGMTSMKVAPYGIESFRIKASGNKRIRVIGLIENQIMTDLEILQPKKDQGFLVSDTERDILKIAVVERHNATGNFGLGFIKGFGLKRGAIASTFAHDSHNIIAVGVNDHEILMAIKEIEKMQGGVVAVENDRVIERLPLPIAGLMSDKSLKEVATAWNKLEEAAHKLGSDLTHPYMVLSFMSLPVVPKLKITDKGLVEVEGFKHVSLFV